MTWWRGIGLIALALLALSLAGVNGEAVISVPGVIPASGCRVGAVLSTDEFTSTGFSQVRTVGPEEEAPAGAWVLADDFVPATGVVPTPNCPAPLPDGLPLFVVALKLTPTIGSWQDADIQELKLIQDTNCNAQFEDGLDFTMQIKSGSELRSGRSVTFFNGPQSPLFIIPSGPPFACGFGALGIMVVVVIGPNPLSGSQFGLSLEAMAADVPGMGTISSGFSSSRNPAGSSIRLQLIGGGSGAPPPGPPGGGGTGLKRFDTNNNDIIDDPEFFAIIDAWINGQLDDATFFQAVDLWVSQRPLSSAGLSSSARVELRLGRPGAEFTLRGAGIASWGVEIYALDGRRIFAQETTGARLEWNYLTSQGQPVANGVYLYVATVKGMDGRISQSEVRKLLVLR